MRRAILAAALGWSLLAPTAATAGASLALYDGPDRQPQLIAAARKDGSLTLYTSMPEKDLPPLIGPFERKYGITVKVWRASSAKIVQRAVSEAAARRFDVDAILMSGPELEALHRETLLQPVASPYVKGLIPAAVRPHRAWVATFLSIWVQAYNTNLVKRDDLPRTYRDLLDARWKGKLGIEVGDYDWFATLASAMGRDQALQLFRDVVLRNGVSVRQGHTLLANLVVSGEVPLALTVYSYMPEAAKRRGAPVDWIALEPVVARANAVAVARRAPRPNAALLFHDFMLTDGQDLLAAMDYVPTSAGARAPLPDRKLHLVDPALVLDERERWTKAYEVIFLKRGM